MRKQFITAVVLAALIVTGCGASAGDTAVTAADPGTAVESVQEETSESEAAGEEETEKDEAETEDKESEEAKDAGEDEESEAEEDAESEDEESETEEDAEAEDEESEADEDTESEDEESEADEDAEAEDEESEADENTESEDEESEADKDAESEDEESEADKDAEAANADGITEEETRWAPRTYSSGSRSSRARETASAKDEETEADEEAEEEEPESDEESESVEEAEAEEDITKKGTSGVPRTYGNRSGSSRARETASAEDEETEADEESEAEDEEEAEAEEESEEEVNVYSGRPRMFPSKDKEAESEDEDGGDMPRPFGSRPDGADRPSGGRSDESGRGRAPLWNGGDDRGRARDDERDNEYEDLWDDIFPDLDEGEYDNFWDVFPDVSDGEYDNFWDMFPDIEFEDEDEKAVPEFEESDGLTFRSNKDGTCVITGIGTCTDTVLVIPEKSPKGDKVTAIGEGAFDHARGIEGIIIKDLTVEIEPKAFMGSSVESIIAYDSTLVINEDAFSNAGDLTYFYAEESEIVTDPYAFDTAFDGADLVFTDSTLVFDDASFVYSGIRSIVADDCTFIIGEDAFDYCEDIETIEFSDCNVDIGAYAFFCSGDQMELLFEMSDVTIGEDAFAFSDIINLEINGSTVQIGEDAFDYCEAVENLIVRASVVETDPYAFYGCGNQAKVVFQNGEVTLGRDAFAFADIESLKIVKCDADIGQEAFKSCSGLRRVDLGSGNVTIGKRAFYHCADLREISIGENGRGPHSIVIGDNAFEFSGLEKVMIGKGSVEIGSGAFKYCEDLKDVKIRGAVEKIGRNAFFRCDDGLVIHYGGEDYDSKTIQDVASSVEDESPKPDLRKDARSRTILRASFDGSTFGDTYEVGETWSVSGQWKITIDSVYETAERSEASEHEPGAVYVVNYTYENTGYKGANGASSDLYLSLSSANIEDVAGTAGYIYPGSIAASPYRIAKGESCTAQGRIGVDNPGNFTITFKMTDGNRESQQASFLIDVSNLAEAPVAQPAVEAEAGEDAQAISDMSEEAETAVEVSEGSETGAEETAQEAAEAA